MVPCQALLLLIYIVHWNKCRRNKQVGKVAFSHMPASHTCVCACIYCWKYVIEFHDHTTNSSQIYMYYKVIIESVDSISRDGRGFPLTQYITNGRISRAG